MAEPIEKTGPATDVEHKAAEDAGKETVAHELKDSMGHVTQETWICCDGCGKWRSVPQELADSLDEEAAWYCKDNPDQAFNSCDINQQFTDEEIDNLMHAAAAASMFHHPDVAENGSQKMHHKGSRRRRPAVWQKVDENIYPHRSRKQQDEDEIMVCQCKQVFGADEIGCGDHCLNRMLNIECVEKFCPNGSKCCNQAFSRREYASLDVKRAGKKGFGLFAKQNLKAGDFIIEYVGEVLDEEEYSRRKQFYEGSAQRHYYFMNIGNGEVIDATRKGGVGRFINHSCSPNCETQKWVVKGELSIGLFASVDIKSGEELTFDYNFERYGDKPVKCLCGSPVCRGLIGGEKEKASDLNLEISVPDEEDDLEPIMVTDREEDMALRDILDRLVGLGWEYGWTPELQEKLERLARSKGVELPDLGSGLKSEELENEDKFLAEAAAAALSSLPESAIRKTRSKFAVSQRTKKDPDWREPATGKSLYGNKDPDKTSLNKLNKARLAEYGKSVSRGVPNINATTRSSGPARSEVQRRLDVLAGKSGRLKQVTDESIMEFLRLFNLCIPSPAVNTEVAGDVSELGEFKSIKGATHLHPHREAVRQRHRELDVSLLLDTAWKTDSLTAKNKLVKFGLLRQLLPLFVAEDKDPRAGNRVVLVRRALELIETMPFTAEDVRQTRTAHLSFEDVSQQLAKHSDYGIRTTTLSLLKKWGLSSSGDAMRYDRLNKVIPPTMKYGGFSTTSTPSYNSYNHAPHFGRGQPQWGYHSNSTGGHHRHGEQKRYNGFETPSSGDRKAFLSRNYEDITGSSSRMSDDTKRKKSRWEPSPQTASNAPIPEPEMSPMTDDEEEGLVVEPKEEKKLQRMGAQETKPTAERGDLQMPSMPNLIEDPFDDSTKQTESIVYVKQTLDTWETPDADFENFVINLLRKRIGKYEQPDHPARLSREEATAIFKQARREVMKREKEAYELRMKSGSTKPIIKDKVEGRVKQYVRESVQRLQLQKQTMS